MNTLKCFSTSVFLAILLVPMIMAVAQPAMAAEDMPVYLKVYAEPNPVGVGQTVFISLFFTKPIPIVGSAGGASLYTGLSVSITKPDGSNQTLGPYTSDTTGGVGGIEFVPDVAGNYTVQGYYKGQTITGTVQGKTFTYNILPTVSDAITFTVQTEQIQGNPIVPLPTEYWSRPIYATNYQWSQLGGSWWGLGKPSFTDTGGYDGQGNNFNPYTQAPNTGHIMWVKPVTHGGQVGGPVSGDQESQYTTSSIAYRQFEPVILNGVIYYKMYPSMPTTATSPSGTPGWNAVDLRTGELLWHKDTNDTLVFGMVMQFHTIQEYGTEHYLVAISSTTTSNWNLYDPMTGQYEATITNVTSGTSWGLVETRDDSPQGTVYMYMINGTYPKLYVNMWNSTRCIQGAVNPGITVRVGTSTANVNINYTRGYQWSVLLPSSITTNGVTTNITGPSNDPAAILKNPALSIAARDNQALLLRSYGEAMDTFAAEFGESSEIEMAVSAVNGSVLWGPVNRTLPRYHEISVLAAGEGYYVEQDKDTNIAYVYNLYTGQAIGSGVQLEGNALSTLSRGGAIAYGKAYIWDFGGYVNAIDLKTGTLAWTYQPRDAGYNTPYGIYPIWHFGSHSIADGKLFLSEGRMYDPPLFSDAHKLAINCTDGSLVWSVLGYYGREPSPIADGYLVAFNCYDGQAYTFGKGPTMTTANAPTNVLQAGSSVLITGSVTDISAGTKDADRTARFPQGVPAVSDDSQSDWMAYVYMQQPQPTNATGVPVTLSVVDSNGNYRTIGATQTDSTGFYSYQWVPDITGKYTIYVSFGGSESYWPSHATTAFTVDNPAVTIAPTQQAITGYATSTDVLTYIAGATIAIIIAIAIVGLLILRKH